MSRSCLWFVVVLVIGLWSSTNEAQTPTQTCHTFAECAHLVDSTLGQNHVFFDPPVESTTDHGNEHKGHNLKTEENEKLQFVTGELEGQEQDHLDTTVRFSERLQLKFKKRKAVASLQNPILDQKFVDKFKAKNNQVSVALAPKIESNKRFKQHVIDSMLEYNRNTCLLFVMVDYAGVKDDVSSFLAKEGTLIMAGSDASYTTAKGAVALATWADEKTVQHELGHVIGFDHQQKRSDRDTSLFLDEASCKTKLKATTCPSFISSSKPFCEKPNAQEFEKHGLKMPNGPMTPQQLAECMETYCVSYWLLQYEKSKNPNVGSVDLSSVMLYPFNECVYRVELKNDPKLSDSIDKDNQKYKPGDHLTESDYKNINSIYGCKKIKVLNEKQTVTVDYSPSWTMSQFSLSFRTRYPTKGAFYFPDLKVEDFVPLTKQMKDMHLDDNSVLHFEPDK